MPNAPNISLGTFKLLDIQSTTELIRASSTKSCECNPIPTTLLKASVKEILSTSCKIIIQSLQSTRIPSIFKATNVRPLLKKQTFNQSSVAIELCPTN